MLKLSYMKKMHIKMALKLDGRMNGELGLERDFLLCSHCTF